MFAMENQRIAKITLEVICVTVKMDIQDCTKINAQVI